MAAGRSLKIRALFFLLGCSLGALVAMLAMSGRGGLLTVLIPLALAGAWAAAGLLSDRLKKNQKL